MPRDDDSLVADMLEIAERALRLLGSSTRTQFEGDEKLQLALVHLIQQIGEAASRVSDSRRKIMPSVAWRQIIGMRHRLVHEYHNVDLDVVWQVAAGDLPTLIDALRNP